jgi:hypothetical protein
VTGAGFRRVNPRVRRDAAEPAHARRSGRADTADTAGMAATAGTARTTGAGGRPPHRDELGAKSAQTGRSCGGIVVLEGGGTTPHPMGGGAGYSPIAGTSGGEA